MMLLSHVILQSKVFQTHNPNLIQLKLDLKQLVQFATSSGAARSMFAHSFNFLRAATVASLVGLSQLKLTAGCISLLAFDGVTT